MLALKIPDWYKLHRGRKAFDIEIGEGYTPLIGKNGSGKTTTLQQIKELLDNDETTQLIEYSNLIDGGSMANSKYIFHNMIQQAAESMANSEGQNIVHNFANIVLGGLRTKLFDAKAKGKKTVLLLDSLDSGTSIDSDAKIRDIIEFVIEDAQKHSVELYIIAACNSYEMVKGADAIDVRTGKHETFDSYEDYAFHIAGIASSKYARSKYERVIEKQTKKER